MVAPLFMGVASAEGSKGDGLSGVIQQLTTMRNGIQVLHDDDSGQYEQVACHCESETDKLSAEETGLIPKAAALIQKEAATVEDRTAFIEKSVVDLATNRAELADYIEVEKNQVAAWEKRRSQLNADIAEVTQAANALAAAQEFLGSHPEIVALVEDMDKDVTGSLKGYNKALAEETADREEQNKTFNTNKKNEETQIKDGEKDIEDATAAKAKATGTMLETEADIKRLSKQLGDLVDYCELQAKDWDEQHYKRSEDFKTVSIAINILTCGSESCSSDGDAPTFLQLLNTKATGVSTLLKSNNAAKKAAIRKLVRIGKETGNKDLVLLQDYMKRDVLMGAKKLIRTIIEKLTREAALDQGEMNVCSTQLAECKTKRDFAMQHVESTKIALEELSQSMEEDKAEFTEKGAEWKENFDDASEISHVDIPTLISTYDSTKAQLTEEKTWLQEAIIVLRKHFGTEENSLASGPKDSSFGLESSPSRKVSNAGDTQSTGARVVNMLQQNLEERKVELSELRDNHVKELAGLRKQKADLSATAGGAKARYEYLQMTIEKETAEFGTKLAQLQGKMDVAASNGRCVQELEPCGVQMDRRAQREQEIAALKEAWTILAEGTDDQAPADWGV